MAINPIKVLKQAEALIAEKEIRKAGDLLNAAIRERPKDPRLYAALARIFIRELNKFEEAEKVVVAAAARAPETSEILQEALHTY